MRRLLFAGLAGAIFGTGLLISGMTDTRKVLGFLDFFGAWDPTLAAVMGGAIIPMVLAWRVAASRRAPLMGGAFPASPAPRLGPDLVAGSIMFGMGWGLVGLCPGPALASITWGGWQGVLFLVAMGAGMIAAVPVRTRFGVS